MCDGRRYHRGSVLICHPLSQKVRAYRGIVNLSIEEHRRRQRTGFRIILELDAFNVYVFRIPVIGVFNIHVLLLRRKRIHQVGAAIPKARVVEAKLRAVFFNTGCAHWIIAAELKQAQEVDARRNEGILERIIIKCFHANGIEWNLGRGRLSVEEGRTMQA